MRSLSKTQQKEWEALTTALDRARDALMPHVESWNEEVERLNDAEGDGPTEAEVEAGHLKDMDRMAEIGPAWTNYTDALEAVRSFAENVRDEAQAYYDDRTEAWQSSAKGEEYQGFIESWGEVADMEVTELADAIDDVTGELAEPEDSADTPIPAAMMYPGQ